MPSAANNAINNTVGASISGVTNTLTITNPSNTASSQAQSLITVGGATAGTSAGNCWEQWTVGTTRSFAIGIKNSATPTLTMTTAAAATVNPSTATPAWELTVGSGFNYDNTGTTSFGIGFNVAPTSNYAVNSLKSSLNDFYGAQFSNTNAGNASSAGISLNNDGTANATVSVCGTTFAAATIFQNKLVFNVSGGATGIVYNCGASGAHYFYTNAAGGIQAAQLDATNGIQVNTVQALTANGDINVRGNGTGNVTNSVSRSGANVTSSTINGSNTASSQAGIVAQVAGGTAGDAYYQALISAGQTYTWGLDNSDSDAWVLAASATLGTTNAIRVSSAGAVTLPAAALPTGSGGTEVTSSGASGNILTSNGSVWTSAAPSGAGLVQFSKKTLTSAQVKALHGTPIEIVAAPGTNKAIIVISQDRKFVYGGTNVFTAGAAQTIVTSYNSATTIGTVCANAPLVASATSWTYFGVSNFASTTTTIQNLNITLYNPVATEITGNAANDNSIIVDVAYNIADYS